MNGLISNYFLRVAMTNLPDGISRTQHFKGSGMETETKGCLPSCRFCTEVFHVSMAKKYVNKSQHYFYNGMIRRTQLAVIDHNSNVGREIATTMSAEERYRCVYPKLQKKWVARPKYKGKTYQFVHDLLSEVILLKTGVIEVPPTERPNLPQNIVPTPLQDTCQDFNKMPKSPITAASVSSLSYNK